MESNETSETGFGRLAPHVVSVTGSYAQPRCIVKVGDSLIGSEDNFSLSAGTCKLMNTANIMAIAASAIMEKPVLAYDILLHPMQKRVLYVDTRQHPHRCQEIMKLILSMAELNEDEYCERFTFLSLRNMTPKMRVECIGFALKEFADIGLVIIDDVRDLLFDTNCPQEIAQVICLMNNWASKFRLHIHCVLYQDIKDENMIGYMEAELIHRAESIIQVKEGDKSQVAEVYSVLVPEKPFLPFAFQLDQAGLPEPVDIQDCAVQTRCRKFDFEIMSESLHRKALDVAFSEIPTPITYSPLLERLGIGYASIGFERSRNVRVNLLKFLVKNKMVVKKGKGYVYNHDFHYVPIR